MLPHQFKRLTELLRSISSAIERALEKQENAIRDASIAAEKGREEPPRIIASAISELRIPKEERDKTSTAAENRHRENLKQQRWLTGWTAAAFVAAAIYAGIAAKTYSKIEQQATDAHNTLIQIQQQTTLMQNQTVGTKGAVLQFVPSLNILANKEDGPVFSSTVRAWSDRVTARHIALTVEVQRISLPNKTHIGPAIRCDINAPQLASFQTGMNEIARVCELPGFNTKAADEVMFTRQSVTVSGSLVYENGFDQTISENICQTYIGYRYKGEIKGPNGSTNLVSGGDESFHDCGDFDRILSRAMRFKHRYQENYIPDRP